MNREQMVEKVRGEISEWEAFMAADGHMSIGKRSQSEMADERVAARVLDAILPQVSTVEELEALPDESVVMDDSNGDSWSRSTAAGATLWHGHGCPNPDTSSFLIEWAAPLTVVWQP